MVFRIPFFDDMSSPFIVPLYGPKNGSLFGPATRVVGTRSMKSNRTNGPNLRPRKKEKRKKQWPSCGIAKAAVVWKWNAHLLQKAAALGKVPLLLNFDETSIPLVHKGLKGNIMVLNGRRAWQQEARQPVRGGEDRMNFTLLTMICDRPEIQIRLPQIIFVSQSILRVPEWADVCANLPRNVYVKRMPSSWNTAQQLVVIIRLLKAVLSDLCVAYQPIISFDAAPLHLSRDVLSMYHEMGLWWVLIPARLTWLMQPCDTHVFLCLKRFLKSRFQSEYDGYLGRVSVRYMLDLVIRSIRVVVQGHNWRNSFAETGLAGDAGRVSPFIKRSINCVDLAPFPDDVPTMAELRLLWPRNKPMPDDIITTALFDPAGYAADSEHE